MLLAMCEKDLMQFEYVSMVIQLIQISRDNRLANTQFGGNRTTRISIRGQGKDIFFLSKGNGVYSEFKKT